MSSNPPSKGRLFGVGLGPGDPGLVTVKAAKLLATVPVAAYFAKKGACGRAHPILERWAGAACCRLPLHYPLTTEEPFSGSAYAEALDSFYSESENALAAHLSEGRDVALVCEGDPLFYGSFIHIFLRIKGRFEVEIIPGVTGMSGCWSAAQAPIAWGDDVLSVLPGTLERTALLSHLARSDALVIIKIGSNLAKIRDAIAESGRLAQAVYVEHGTAEAEAVIPLAAKTDGHAPYFSSILIPGQGRRP